VIIKSYHNATIQNILERVEAKSLCVEGVYNSAGELQFWKSYCNRMKALPGSNAMLEANEFGLYVNIIIN
jgi:hypothetical protein